MWFGRKRGLKALTLHSGLLRFTIPDGETTVTWEADMVTLKLALEDVEAKYPVSEGATRIATTEFLQDVEATLQTLGCPKCSVSLARQVWIAVTETFWAMDRDFRRQVARITR